MRRERPRLGELLERRGAITREQLLRALRNQKVVGGKLGTCLLEIDALSEEALLQALAEQQECSAAGADDLRGVPDVVLHLVPGKVARRLFAVPFKASGTQAKVAVLDCNDLAVLDELSFVTGRRVHLHVTSEARLFEALDKYYGEPCSQRFGKLVDRLNRSRYLWRAEGSETATPTAETAGGVASTPSREPPSREFLPAFQSTAGLDLPPLDLPGAAAPPRKTNRHGVAAETRPPVAEVGQPIAPPQPPPAPQPPPPPAPEAPPPAARLEAPAVPTPTPTPAVGPPAPTPEVGEPPAPPPSPLSLDEAESRLQKPLDRDSVGATLIEFAGTQGRRAMLFKVVRDGIAGWLGAAEVASGALSSFRVPRSRPSVFRSLLEGAPIHRGPLSELKADADLLELRASETAPTDVLLLPLLVRDRTVAILYLEPSGEVFAPSAVSDLQRIAAKASAALELCVLRTKLART